MRTLPPRPGQLLSHGSNMIKRPTQYAVRATQEERHMARIVAEYDGVSISDVIRLNFLHRYRELTGKAVPVLCAKHRREECVICPRT